MTDKDLKKKKVYEGLVVSTKMDKVAVVKMQRKTLHPLYKKSIWRSKKYFVRDEDNTCKEGDTVQFFLSRPYSKKTKFKLLKVV